MFLDEEVVLFGARSSIAGIITVPPMARRSPRLTAVILLNAGLVHRVGPGRIYVKIARQLSALGFVVLRFDFSGIGDSPARSDTLCFEKSTVAETREAMDYLGRTRGIEHFVLLGGCSGAFASFETASCDARVLGAVLINFQMPESDEAENSERSTRNAAHYYRSLALFDPKSWRRLLSGKSDYLQVARVLRRAAGRWFATNGDCSAQTTGFQTKLRELANRKATAVFICSQGDSRLRDLREQGGTQLKRLCAAGDVVLDIIPGADHTFTTHEDQQHLLKTVCKRIDGIACRIRVAQTPTCLTQSCSFKSILRPVTIEELHQSESQL